MRLIIDLPDNEVPKRREIVEIGLQFMDGEVCECTYPFQILPKGHGRLIDADELKNEWKNGFYKKIVDALMDDAPTVIEADREAENEQTMVLV